MFGSIRALLIANFLAWRNYHFNQPIGFNRTITPPIFLFITTFSLYWISDLFIIQNSTHDLSIIRYRIGLLITIGTMILVKLTIEGTIQIFYESHETSFLFHTPTNSSSIFIANLVTLIGRYLPKMIVWLVPPWLVVVRHFHLSWSLYFLVFPICCCYLLIVVSQTVLAVLILMQIPSLQIQKSICQQLAFWSKSILNLLTMLIGIITVLLITVSLLSFSETRPFQWIEQWQNRAITWLIQPDVSWGPIQWMYQVFLSSMLGGVQSGLVRSIMKLLAGAFLMPFLTITLSSWLYRSSWERQQIAPSFRSSNESLTETSSKSKIGMFIWQFPLSASIYKDLLVFMGRKGRWLTLLLFSIIQLVMIYSVVLSIQKATETNYAIFGLLSQINLYSAILTFGLTFYGFKADKEMWWLLQLSPKTALAAYISKYLSAILLAFAYSGLWTVCLLMMINWSIADSLLIFLISFLSLTAIISLNTAVGCLPWVNDYRSEDSHHSIISLFTIGVATLINVLFLITPFLIWQMTIAEEINIGSIKGTTLQAGLIFILIVITMIMVSTSMLIGQYSLKRSLFV